MKKQLSILIFAFLSINCISQISYKKSYFIDNSDSKTECLIKNVDWKNNPSEFKYKLLETEQPKTASITSVKEFGIYNFSKYVRDSVYIDRSSADFQEMSKVKKADFNKEQLYLKVLVEGKATLYFYEDGNLTRFFFKTSISNIEQLVFKNYIVDNNRIAENNSYKSQLLNNLKCSSISMETIENIDYNKNDLVDLFKSYNNCTNSNFIEFDKKQDKNLFNLTIRPGLNISSLSIENHNAYKQSADFGTKLSFRFGIEAEIFLPFNRNKWAFIVEPTYQYFKSEKDLESPYLYAKVDYSSIELPIGLRYYAFINEVSKLSINVSYMINFDLDSKIDFEQGLDLNINSLNNWAFGIGYNYNEKYSLELRYLTNRDILRDYNFWDSKYNTISVILGFTVF